MVRLTLLIAGLSLLPISAFSDEAQTLSCAQALEQIATLQTHRPVYKLTGPDERHYIGDAARPSEIARLQRVVAASCSTEPKTKALQQAEADRLHLALSPACAVARDELAAMEQPRSRVPADRVETQRSLVAAKCPMVDTTNRWLIKWDGRSTLAPLN
jgi:hypothetical protein